VEKPEGRKGPRNIGMRDERDEREMRERER